MRNAIIHAAAAGVAALAVAGPVASAPAIGTARARAVIAEPAMVRMAWMMAMPSVAGSESGAAFMGNMPSMSMGMMMMPLDGRLTIDREDPEAAPTAPSEFEVTRSQGGQRLLLRTASGDGFTTPIERILMGGSILGGAAASIEVGTTPASHGLVVVVQYN